MSCSITSETKVVSLKVEKKTLDLEKEGIFFNKNKYILLDLHV